MFYLLCYLCYIWHYIWCNLCNLWCYTCFIYDLIYDVVYDLIYDVLCYIWYNLCNLWCYICFIYDVIYDVFMMLYMCYLGCLNRPTFLFPTVTNWFWPVSLFHHKKTDKINCTWTKKRRLWSIKSLFHPHLIKMLDAFFWQKEAENVISL